MSRRSRQARGSGRAFKNLAKMVKKWKKCLKNRFSLQQLPGKGHFRKEMHQKKIRLRRRKSQKKFRACGAKFGHVWWTPPAGGVKKIPPHSHTVTHPYTAACATRGVLNLNKIDDGGRELPYGREHFLRRKWTKVSQIPIPPGCAWCTAKVG